MPDDLEDRHATAELGDVFQCCECDYVCSSTQQLRLHMFKSHGTIRVARKYVDDRNSCPACLRACPTRTQALRHLYNSKKCSSYALHCDPIDDDLRVALDEAEARRLKQFRADGGYDCCALRSSDNIPGPLIYEYRMCYAGRPIPNPPS